MKKEYKNIEKYGEEYYTLPKEFHKELISKLVKEKGQFRFWNNITSKTEEKGKIIELHSIMGDEEVQAQFKTTYYEKNRVLEIEEINIYE